MSEFWFGFVFGVASVFVISGVCTFLAVVFMSVVDDLEEPEEQPDIRLTTIKSEHIRSVYND